MIYEFSLFVVLQSFFINGVKYCFEKDGIFYKISPTFFERVKDKVWTQNLWRCVKCMSLPYSMLTFWPAILLRYGYHGSEILLWIFDVFILIPLNFQIYKKM